MALGGVRGLTILPGNSANNMDAARLKEQREDTNAPQQMVQNLGSAIAAFGTPGQGPVTAATESSDTFADQQEENPEEPITDLVPETRGTVA